MSVAASNNDGLSINHATVPKARSAACSVRRSINQDRSIYEEITYDNDEVPDAVSISSHHAAFSKDSQYPIT